MSDAQLNVERNRFIILNFVRISGAVMILLALAVLSRSFLDLPKVAGYAFLAIGIIDFIVAPLLLAQAWRSKPDQ